MGVDKRHTHTQACESAASKQAAITQLQSVPKAVPSQPTSMAILSRLPLPGLALTGVKGIGVEKTGKGQGWDTG